MLTLALLRCGCDTAPCRLTKELGPGVAPEARLRTVSEQLYPAPEDRSRELTRARESVARAALAVSRLPNRLVCLWDASYPELLRQIPDPPLVLWLDGQDAIDSVAMTAVAVVGSRDATPSSLVLARTLGRQLAEAGLVVVSGLARGVDAAAHLGALEAGGRTVAVLGSGLDVVYPHQHQDLARDVSRAGALASELPPWAPPLPRHFPLRNRIISGLSRAVVVVEAGEKSGSLITARMALEQGRDVLAVPGGPLSGRHRGANRLIKDGARLVETVEDVLEEIRWDRKPPVGDAPGPQLPLNGLEAMMAPGEGYTVEDLARRTGLAAAAVLADLGLLELAGRITRLAGGQFMRLPPRR